ncbi:Type I phosphodiesterase/nucleotide pyrophosphatase [Paraburkholderia piptadeniae]|uniref:Type I phosphodiesterase/nucleotide pyrophosphatase n=1 Tax=Paraburkholderia piptadeniae TaxID=1701573 RepID=A0A1N7SWQ4_9BURK|nr:alkaline phosphatase family protein [Paraburkholderia piptadeniae]SIT51911.1 Type I phosphodiesterase/nucleotide pyrophosphatase [Paraburkholderia piptadeniae]
MNRLFRWVGAGALLGSVILPAAAAQADDAQAHDQGNQSNAIKHVLLISVDGLHEQDVARCIGANTCPNLALLAKSGVTYTNAYTPGLSDSFPGLAALVTGGSPKTAGLFYDVSYDRTLYAPADTGCTGKQGWNVVFDETTGIDAQGGGALIHLDGGGAFNPDAIPHAKVGNKCVPVYPHDYIKTNTIFEVVKQHVRDSRTAWADKHAWGYDWLNGPSGRGVDDLSRTEINSINPATGNDYTDAYKNTEIFDNFHVNSIINEIDGKDSTGKRDAPVPTLFGTNFQTLSIAQKATVASGGGYLDASFTPSPQVTAAIAYVDDALGKMVAELKARNLASSTMMIVTAKHGQSPTDHTKLVKNGDTVTALLEANNYLDPNGNFGQNNNAKALNDGTGLVGTGLVQTDDVGLIWLRDQSQLQAAVATLKANLSCNAPGICADGPQAYILSGPRLASMFGDPSNGRTPDIIVQPNPGVIYTSSQKKDEEHGGNAPDDSHLGLVVSFPDGHFHGERIGRRVTTTQVAPTILRALGLNPNELHSVKVEGTPVLPGLDANN